jgi:CheY-like chemotaxis protein
MAAILVVGDDELLLETRAAVLRTIGAETVSCRGSSALAIQENRQFDMVILCHTLPMQLCVALAETIHARWPKTRILLLSPTAVSEQSDFDVPLAPDPERLLQRTVELLGHRRPLRAEAGRLLNTPSASSMA